MSLFLAACAIFQLQNRTARRALPALSLLIFFALSGSRALAWFEFGHMEIAASAWNRLDPSVQAKAAHLLKLNPMYPLWVDGVPDSDRDRIAFIKAAVWADDIKDPKKAARYTNDGDHPPPGPEASQNIGYDDLLMHKYWHLVDIPFSPDGTRLARPAMPNAQTQIAAFRAALSDPNKSDDIRSYDLVWLLHLVGDVHQPLHATSRFTRTQRTGDEGGNLVAIECGEGCSDDKLHFFWDDLPGLGKNATPEEAAAAAKLLPGPEARLASIADERIWIRESFQAAKKFAYASPVGPGRGPFPLSDGYKSQAETIVERRVALAGARLANLLTAALK
jgi:hypothetical protein